MNRFLNQVRREASNVVGNSAFMRTGIVNTFDPVTFTCVVQYEPDNSDDPTGSLSPSLPIASLAVGNGFGILAAPNVGDRVAVHFVSGFDNVGVVCCGLFNNDADVPPPINAGEYYLIHQSGTYIKFLKTGELDINGQLKINLTAPQINITTTGDINLNAGANLTATVTGNTTINSTGTATLNGSDVTVTASNSASITANNVTFGDGTALADFLVKATALITAFNNHVHTAQGATSNTTVPTVLLTNSIATTVMKGA